MSREDEPFELMEAIEAPPRPDFSRYRYDAPFALDDPPDAEEEPFPDPPAPAPYFYDGLYGEDEDEDEDDALGRDDELFGALDEALDEIEEEARVEAVRQIAIPEHDELAVHPEPERLYRKHLQNFLGGDPRLVAPRYTQICRRAPVEDAQLRDLLEDGQRRARMSREQRKAFGKITNPERRSALIY